MALWESASRSSNIRRSRKGVNDESELVATNHIDSSSGKF